MNRIEDAGWCIFPPSGLKTKLCCLKMARPRSRFGPLLRISFFFSGPQRKVCLASGLLLKLGAALSAAALSKPGGLEMAEVLIEVVWLEHSKEMAACPLCLCCWNSPRQLCPSCCGCAATACREAASQEKGASPPWGGRGLAQSRLPNLVDPVPPKISSTLSPM